MLSANSLERRGTVILLLVARWGKSKQNISEFLEARRDLRTEKYLLGVGTPLERTLELLERRTLSRQPIECTAVPWRAVLCGVIREAEITYIYIFFFNLFMIDIGRKRGRDTGGGRSRLHAGTPTWDSIPAPDPGTPVSRPGLKAGAKPLSHPGIPCLIFF